MNDISYCNASNCPLKDKCARYLIKENAPIPQEYRWMVEEAFKNGKCKLYKKKKNG